MPCAAGNNEKSCFMWGSLSSRVQSEAHLTRLVCAGNQGAVSSHGYMFLPFAFALVLSVGIGRVGEAPGLSRSVEGLRSSL